MTQQRNSPRRDSGHGNYGRDNVRMPADQPGDRDDVGSRQPSFSERDNQASTYTDIDRNYGGDQSNYGSSGSRQDWGEGSSNGTDWQAAPGGYGRDAADFGSRPGHDSSPRQGSESYGHYGGNTGNDWRSPRGNEAPRDDHGPHYGRDSHGSARSYAATQGSRAIPGDFGNGSPGSNYIRDPANQGDRQQHWDADYHQWRSEQMRNLDNDYSEWRRDRYKKFSDEFNTWRSNRRAPSGPQPSGGATPGNTSESTSDTKTASGGDALSGSANKTK